MVRYMLDTNHVSYIARGTSQAARQRLESVRGPDTLCISAITEAELLYGLAKQPHATVLRAALQTFFDKVTILPWGHDESAAYGMLRAQQEARGKPLDPMDMLIAAHAVAARSVLVSHDRVFAQVTDLPGLVDWATDVRSGYGLR
jgi:tRNA(fMet)-specific endonuclease VapC